MEAKHTPGPWKAIEWTCHSRTTVVTAYGHEKVVTDCAPGPVSGYLDAEAEANAQLIAAAPEMYTALVSLLPMLYNGFEPDNQSKAYRTVEAVISKALGE
jgi:hypothetical protein